MDKPKVNALEILRGIKLKDNIRKYPTVPHSALPKPKYNDSTANGLTACIKDFIELCGGVANRVNSQGNWKAGKWIKSGSTVGAADLNIVLPKSGKSLQVEIKMPGDKLRPAQITQMEKVRAAGGLYFVAHSFQQFYEYYLTLNG